MSKAFLIFTGYNDRAVVAICRALAQREISFKLIAASDSDAILRTCWANSVAWVRKDRQVNMSLFEQVRLAVREDTDLVYCPTTEFINNFVLYNREALKAMGIHVLLPLADVYFQMTNKNQSVCLAKSLFSLSSPRRLEWEQATAPCVFKPNRNVSEGKIHYPILCFSQNEVVQVKKQLNPDRWFVQEYILGQSHYLCGYLSINGEYRSYWQTNLVQQPNGKSIVLARTGDNPGLDEGLFFKKLSQFRYFGPVMIELIEDTGGHLYFIEINPRFWGPLQLAVDACPEIFDLYAKDSGFPDFKRQNFSNKQSTPYWYAWQHGFSRQLGCRFYPAADTYSDIELQGLFEKHDVYGYPDTNRLHGYF
jgi:hypothetical protein